MTDPGQSRPATTGTVERGRFTDRIRTFSVRTSSMPAPDSFQVFADEFQRELVLVVSGINSGALRATWGAQWRTASEGWRDWCEATAFMVFYNGGRPDAGKVRVCNG